MDADPLRLPLADLAGWIGLTDPLPEPAAALAAAGHWGELIQEFRPFQAGLEWQLGQRVWMSQGARPFVEGGVPHLANNSGTLSSRAAALLLEALAEHPTGGTIRVLEIGAGIGLFARLLLDDLAQLCSVQGRDEYARIEYWVTDASPTAVERWRHIDLFREHRARVVLRACTAEEAHALQPEPWQAVLANYVFDVLPATVLRRGAQGWEQLHARCWIRADAATLRHCTGLSPAELRARAEAGDAASLDELVPLLPLLESETAFRPIDDADLPASLAEHPPGEAFTVNTGALQCLDALLPRLAAGAFCLITDYGAEPGTETRQVSAQRFGPVSAIGLNLPALDAHVRGAGFETTAAGGDGEHPLRHRLITSRPAPPRTRRTFEQAFSVRARRWRDEPRALALQHAAAGQWSHALDDYRAAVERAPGDWPLLTEAAGFATTDLRDHRLGAQLAHAALARNRWTDSRPWTVLGDALSGLGQHEAAHKCYQQARCIHPRDPQACLGLARCRLALERPEPALESIAQGLACDSDAMFRHLLLAEQTRALDALALRWAAPRLAAARRSR